MATAKTVKPGDEFAEGVAVTVTDAGVLLGRKAEDFEILPAGHTEHRFQAVRVFLSKDQAPLDPAHFHAGKAHTDRDVREAQEAKAEKAAAALE